MTACIHIWIVLPFWHNLHLYLKLPYTDLPSLKNIAISQTITNKHHVFFFFNFVSRPKSCDKLEGACGFTPVLVDIHPCQSCNFSPGFRRLPRTDQRSFQCPSAGKSARSPTYWPNGFGWWNLKESATSNTETTTKNNDAILKKTHSFQQVQEVNPT